jgi:hypothetical protein
MVTLCLGLKHLPLMSPAERSRYQMYGIADEVMVKY